MAAPIRILVVSDLHVDFPANRERASGLADQWSQEEAEVLAIAGDVSHDLDQLRRTLERFAAFGGLKLFVPGNHDIWVVKPKAGQAQDSWTKLEQVKAACADAGFVCLEERNASLGAYSFVGTMGWYDYSYASPSLGYGVNEYSKKALGEMRYMDADYARWGMPDAHVLDRLLQSFAGRLDEAKGKIVFVGHHVPREDLVLRRGRASWDFFNAFMGSRRLESLLRFRGVERLVFGHTHRPVAFIEPGRFVINNPMGYPRESPTLIERPFVVD